MDLHTESTYWLLKNGYDHSYPPLLSDIKTDVCILGAGITGALASYALQKAGLDVVVVDKRHPGMGSTAASTALLQYEIDAPLYKLIKTAGRNRAENAYLACRDAIQSIGDIVKKEKLSVGFSQLPSFQYASRKKDAIHLEEELSARQRIGLEVDWLDREEIEKRFKFPAPAGLLSKNGAQIGAFRMTHALLSRKATNLHVFDTTKIISIDCRKRGVRLRTRCGHTIRADKLVVACGYESQKLIPFKVVDLSTTYAFISKPVSPDLFWEHNALIWETKTPYLYMRTTPDNCVLVGGRDDKKPYDGKKRRRRLDRKIRGLLDDVQTLRPDLPLYPEFSWAGTFGGTKDALAYVGDIPSMANTYFILGFGGNGIVFSQTGAQIVRDRILGKENPLTDLYTFDR
jgi:Glycine/D-amino acid oxidases (deaminating)